MVRATFSGFTTALSALQENQKRLDIIGHNLSNMNTVGYTRQTLETSSVNYKSPVATYMNGSEVIVGFGVHMNKVTQIRDPYLDAQYRSQMYKASYTDGIQTSLDSLAKIFDESDIVGINQAFNDIRSSLEEMQDSPKINDPIYESELRARMKALTNLLNDASRKLDEAELQEYIRLDGSTTTENGAVQNVNDILRQIGNLNRQIKQNQILGQQSLELMDERNVLLDELSNYIPIEVTYYKDPAHDGLAADGVTPDLSETHYLDKNGNPIAKKEWPDDLRVEMLYTDATGATKRLTLVEGTQGSGDENYGKLELTKLNNDKPYPDAFTLTFTASAADLKNNAASFELSKTNMSNGTGTTGLNQLPGGSIQASLDMLWKDGRKDTTRNDPENGLEDVNGYSYYRKEIDNLAQVFATVINTINIDGAKNDANIGNAADQVLLTSKDGGPITAANIGINVDWSNGKVHVSKAGSAANGTKNPTDTVLNMLEAMKATYPLSTNKNLENIFQNAGITDASQALKGNSFADYMNHVSTTLANDSYHNSVSLKTNVTVLNGIQGSRDSMSGVSLDEEAANMMQFSSAYSAASRFMTALDQMLDKLINSTGVVGR